MVDQRLEFVRLVESGVVSFAEVCRRFSVSRPTGYKWLGRYRDGGVEALVDRSRRPVRSPLKTVEWVEELVCGVRQEHPVWGGRKIRGFLLRQGHTEVPAASTITQILRRNGLLEDLVPQRRAFQRFEMATPNELWQMDFKGWFRLKDRCKIHPFGVLDDHSRFNLALEASLDQQTGTVKGYLTDVFTRYGLPDRMLMDNGSPWGNTIDQPWTPLTVWLADLGIVTNHIRPFRPQTQGKEERFHATLNLEVISTKPQWRTQHEVQDAFDAFRAIYNHHRPHEALGETVAPADRYQPSTRPMPDQLPPIVFPDGCHVRKVSDSASISYQGHIIKVGRAFRGLPVGVRPTTTDNTHDIYYRHHKIKTINL